MKDSKYLRDRIEPVPESWSSFHELSPCGAFDLPCETVMCSSEEMHAAIARHCQTSKRQAEEILGNI